MDCGWLVMRVTIQITRGCAEYLKRCKRAGSRVWWVRDPNGRILDPGGAHPGNHPASFAVSTEPGLHTLGTGSHTRYVFRVLPESDIIRIDGRSGDVLTPNHEA